MNKVIRDFQMLKLLQRILDDWDLEIQFPDLGSDLSIHSWQTSRACLRCLIFVARAYKCMYTLQWTNIRDSLAVKVLRCLKILQERITSEEEPPENSSLPHQKEPIAPSPVHQTKENYKNARDTASPSQELRKS